MNNEDNMKRPNFDPLTGERIIYEDEAVKSTEEVAATEEIASEEVNIEAGSEQYRYKKEEIPAENNTEEQAKPYKSYSETYGYDASGEAGNVFGQEQNTSFGIGGNQESGNSKAQKKAEKKAAGKAARKASGEVRKSTLLKKVCVSVLCGVLAGSAMFGTFYAGVKIFPGVGSNKTLEIATVGSSIIGTASYDQSDSSSSSMNVAGVVKAAMPAVVAISGTVTTTSSSSYFNPFSSGSTQSNTSGTGIIVGKNDTELLIVTNAHVVDGVNNLSVTFIDEQSVSASVKGSKSDKDIAVVAVKISDLKDSTISKIAVAELGDSESLQVGEQVVAIGNALGEGQSATVGWISALNRSITIDSTDYSNLIMTDAAINPGNSGGALINASGQVIGINSAKYADEDVEGMGYAIPISSVKDIIDKLSTKETRQKVATDKASYLGISKCIDVTSAMATTYNVPIGVSVGQVATGSPAEKAGIIKSDIIVEFDGEDVSTLAGLQSLMQYYAAGEKVTLGYYHYNSDNKSYEYREAQVTLGNASSVK